MIHSQDLARKIDFLVETSDELLPLFPPVERAAIMALKKMVKEKATGAPRPAAENSNDNYKMTTLQQRSNNSA